MVALVAIVFISKKTNFNSYVSTAWAQAQKEVKEQIPARLEIERIRHEIAHLDGDLGNMIRPVAEHTAAIAKLKKDIQASQTEIERKREELLKMTKDLESNPKQVVYDGKSYTADRIRTKLNRDFDSFKRLESKLESQRKLLEAKELSLQASHDQLAKVTAKKREYEVRLAQLEADQEALNLAAMGTPFKIDDSRASEIERSLAELEQRQNVLKAELEIKSNAFINDGIPVGNKTPAPDVSSIRRHLETPSTLATTTEVSKN
jgi:chromosome segregation ATPase